MKLSFTIATLAAAAMLASPALGQTTVVENNFVNGNPLSGAGPLESAFYTTSSGSGLASDNGTPGVLDFASGSSGRGIHTLFDTVTLENIGDNVTASFTFTTPATVGSDEDNGFRVGLFNNPSDRDLAQDISASSGTPNPLLGDTGIGGTTPGLAGFSADYDIDDVSSGEPANENQIRQANVGDARGRLLTTTGGFSTIGEEPLPASSGITPDTEFSGFLSITLTGANEVSITSQLGSTTVEATEITPESLDFGFLAFSVSSGAFGSVNNVGEADNGLDFTNVTVTSTVVPEPASFALLAAGAGLLIGRRRKA